MSGPAVRIVETGGIAVTPVDDGAPIATVVETGGFAIRIVENGPPFVLEGYTPPE